MEEFLHGATVFYFLGDYLLNIFNKGLLAKYLLPKYLAKIFYLLIFCFDPSEIEFIFLGIIKQTVFKGVKGNAQTSFALYFVPSFREFSLS